MIEQGEVRLIYKPVYWLLSQIFQMLLDQKYQFSLLLDEHIEKLDIKWKKTFTINQETCDKAMAVVQLQKGEKCSDGDNFKFWSRKHFKIERIGTKQVINRGVARISDWGGAWCERSELHLGVWGLAPSENFKITVYNDRLYSMRDPLQ